VLRGQAVAPNGLLAEAEVAAEAESEAGQRLEVRLRQGFSYLLAIYRLGLLEITSSIVAMNRP
jgi:hypothetical protein